MNLLPKCLGLTALTLALATQVLAADHSVAIKFSKKIKKSQRKTMERDLSLLEGLSFKKEASAETLKVFGIDSLDAETLASWLEARVQYVIRDQKVEDMKLDAKPFNGFENSGVTPIIERGTPRPATPDGKKGVTVMSNIGAALYYAGKSTGNLFELTIPKKGFGNYKVKLSSPRSGVIQIGPGHFLERLLINKTNPKSDANGFGRLSTFFHEARHSDGSGKHLGFFHAVCPAGHDFEGLNACDRNLNGPYKVGALAMKEFLKNCDSCTVEEKEAMKLHYLEAEGRVITETKEVKRNFDDGSLELLELKMEVQTTQMLLIFAKGEELAKHKRRLKEIENRMLEMAEAAGSVSITPSVFWDAAPEGQRI
ncbi:MAG: hypothetical protein HN509_09725 [Halobacteriovoraceae bacterium]|jgi:hypothetical protein|nr:hypothetical protein [Halobacteriovoraceae bacterium]